MPTTQQRILIFLEAHPAASVAEIARALTMTAANVRHHLSALQAQGRVIVAGQRLGTRRGRPTQLYSLSGAARANNIEGLARAAMAELFHAKKETEKDALFKALARRIAPAAPNAGIALTRVLGEAVQRLNDLNYKARWEAHSDAPHVLFYNCPYAAIVADHPELCRMDAALLEHLIGRPVSLASRLGDQRGRAPYCLFLIHI